jgi:hypothetical protein
VYIGRIEGIFCLEWLRTKLSSSVIRLNRLRAYFALSCVWSYILVFDIVYLTTYRPQDFYITVKVLSKYLVRQMITARECSTIRITKSKCAVRQTMFPKRGKILTTC